MRKKWNQEEVNFLIENYNLKGVKYCCDFLQRTKDAVVRKATKLKISDRREKSKKAYSEDNLRRIIKESYSFADCVRLLGFDSQSSYHYTLHKYINLYNIDISHFDGYSKSKSLLDYRNNIKVPLEKILIENSSYNRGSLKKRLLGEQLLLNNCCLCGQDENWNGLKISLILDHINGVRNDNRLDNLRIVCPNCNAGLDTFAGRNLRNKLNKDTSYRKTKSFDRKNFCECGLEIEKTAIRCKTCFSISIRKPRPTYDQLIEDCKILGYSGTGRKYSVSDTSIKNWIRDYENIN